MMNPTRCLAFAAALLVSLAPAYARMERTVEKTFAVAPGGLLTVSTQGGDVKVRTGGGDQVRVVARQHFRGADNDAEADEVARDLELTIEQEGNNVRASARYARKLSGRIFGSWPPVVVDFVVTIPERFNVDLSTSGGDIDVGNLTGSARVKTSGGDITLARVQGPVNGSTSGGDIRVTEAVDEVDLGTSGGDIIVGRASGQVKLETSGGDITVERASGALDASTSGGDVRVTLEGPLTQDISLGTSGGDVVARVDPEAGFHLDASTSGGDVEVNGLTIRIEKGGIGKSRLSGEVNGGGATLKLRSSGGDVTVASR